MNDTMDGLEIDVNGLLASTRNAALTAARGHLYAGAALLMQVAEEFEALIPTHTRDANGGSKETSVSIRRNQLQQLGHFRTGRFDPDSKLVCTSITGTPACSLYPIEIVNGVVLCIVISDEIYDSSAHPVTWEIALLDEQYILAQTASSRFYFLDEENEYLENPDWTIVISDIERGYMVACVHSSLPTEEGDPINYVPKRDVWLDQEVHAESLRLRNQFLAGRINPMMLTQIQPLHHLNTITTTGYDLLHELEDFEIRCERIMDFITLTEIRSIRAELENHLLGTRINETPSKHWGLPVSVLDAVLRTLPALRKTYGGRISNPIRLKNLDDTEHWTLYEYSPEYNIAWGSRSKPRNMKQWFDREYFDIYEVASHNVIFA